MTGEIILWCEGKSIQPTKRKNDTGTSRQEKEEADDILKQLVEKHRGIFNIPKLRLWAHMIQADLHDDFDTFLDVPAFDRSSSKRPKKESKHDALTNAAVTFANVLTDKPLPASTSTTSPMKSIVNNYIINVNYIPCNQCY